LIDAATSVFADQGFEAGAVRAITRMAKANQAAITYHFGGKDGLYRAVLRAAVETFEAQSLIDEQNVAELDRAEALRLVMRQFFLPLSQPGRLGRYIRIFGREGINPSPVYMAFFAEERPRLFTLVETLVRRFLPAEVSPKDVSLTTYWLVQQPVSFVRDADRLRNPPYSLTFDEDQIEWLIDFLTRLSLDGLARGGS
jgi:AcrR family transcriptional regulator